MKTALWETSAGALAALLNSGQPLNMADLYTLTLADGTVYRWSGSDVAVSGNARTWVLGPGLQRTRVRWTVGIEVATLTVTVADIVGTVLGGQALIPYIRGGGFTNAQLQLDRAYWGATDTAPVGALLLFLGRMANIARIDRAGAELLFKAPTEMLDAMVPKEVYQAGCANTVFDAQCGASRAAYTFTGAVVGGTSGTRLTFTASLGKATGYFDLGVVTMTSGACAGVKRTVKTHVSGTPGAITVLNPWPAAIAAGDTFSIEAGCNKSQTDGNGCPKFHTSAEVKQRFRGTPYVPVPETVL